MISGIVTVRFQMSHLTFHALDYMAQKYGCSIGELITEAVREYYTEDYAEFVNKIRKDDK